MAVWVWRELLRFDDTGPLAQELQAWLLLPSQTSSALVVGMAAWLALRRWPRLRALPLDGGAARLGGPLLLGAVAVHAWALHTGARDLQVVSLLLAGAALAGWLWGPRGLRVLALPLAFLLFAMPMPGPLVNAVVYRFQLWTAELTGMLLYAIGQPAFVAGDQILREGDLFTIIEGCSGLRSVETLCMLSVLMADLFRRRGRHAALLFLAAAPIAFLLNSVRAVFLILNPLSETAVLHSAQGIAILLGGLLLLFGLDGLLARVFGDGPEAPPASRSAPQLPVRRAAVAAAALGLLAALPLGVPVWQRPPGSPDLSMLLPSPLPGWSEETIQSDYYRFLGRVGFTVTLQRRYRRGPQPVELFLGVSDHRERARSALSAKTAVPGSGWIVEESGRVAPSALGRSVDYRVLRSGRRRLLAYHWREGLGGLGRETLRALLALDQSPLRRTRHAFVARVTTPIRGPGPADRRAAERRLEAFCEGLRGWLLPAGTDGKHLPNIPDL